MAAMSLNRWLAVLIVVSAGLFAAGAAIERNKSGESGHKEAQTAQPAASEGGGGTHSESGGESSSEGGRGEAHPESGETSSEASGETRSESSEKIFGINPESMGLVIAAIGAAVLLAVAVWLSPIPLVLLAVIAFGVVFAVFDVREVVHQVNESRVGLVVIASLLALIHLAVAATAAVIWRSPTARSRVAASG
jgi:hypothetical protein